MVTLVDSIIFNCFGALSFAGIVWCFFDAVKKNRGVGNEY